MELRHLKYFLTLAEELHFNKAAKKLFISQPPLSRLIKSLENELDVTLFERNNRKVRLTKYGEYLKLEASELIFHLSKIKNQLKLMKKGAANPIKVGYIASVMYVFLPDVLEKLKTKHPELNTVLIELNITNQLKLLQSGELDIVFIRTAEPDTDLVFEHIYDETFTLIFSNQHNLSKKNKVSIRDFKDEPLITFLANCSPMKGISSILKKNKITPNIIHQTSQINTMLRLVESNVGYAIIPSTVLKGFKLNLSWKELDNYPERVPIYIAYKKNDVTEILEEFIQIIKNHRIIW